MRPDPRHRRAGFSTDRFLCTAPLVSRSSYLVSPAAAVTVPLPRPPSRAPYPIFLSLRAPFVSFCILCARKPTAVADAAVEKKYCLSAEPDKPLSRPCVAALSKTSRCLALSDSAVGTEAGGEGRRVMMRRVSSAETKGVGV